MKLEFIFHTSPDRFYNWVLNYTQEQHRLGKLNIPARRSPINLQPVKRTKQDQSSYMTLVMYGHYMLPGSDGNSLVWPPGPGLEYVSFKLLVLDDDRTKITAECLEGPVEPYFRHLLEAIAADYPQTSSIIHDALHVPVGTGKEVLGAIIGEQWLPSWYSSIPFTMEEFAAAAEKHLLAQEPESKIAEQSTRIERDTAYSGKDYIVYNIVGSIEQPDPDHPNVLIAGQRAIGHITGWYLNAEQTRLEVVSEGLDDALVKRIVGGFLASWLQEVDRESADASKETMKVPSEGKMLGTDGLLTVTLETTAGDLSPGDYKVPTQATGAFEVANAALRNLNNQLAAGGSSILESLSPKSDMAGTPEDDHEEGTSLVTDQQTKQPWEQIPDSSWDRTAVKMLWEGRTDPEIAEAIYHGMKSKTVTNRLSVLRSQYPEAVPTRSQLRQMRS